MCVYLIVWYQRNRSSFRHKNEIGFPEIFSSPRYCRDLRLLPFNNSTVSKINDNHATIRSITRAKRSVIITRLRIVNSVITCKTVRIILFRTGGETFSLVRIQNENPTKRLRTAVSAGCFDGSCTRSKALWVYCIIIIIIYYPSPLPPNLLRDNVNVRWYWW